MTNAWGITEVEYNTALKRERDERYSADDRADYFQLCRFYRGQVFYRDAAIRAARRIRYGEACTPIEELHANARLIAAAPDLLDLARDIAGLDHRYLAGGNQVLVNALREWKAAARAAIAKAEGV